MPTKAIAESGKMYQVKSLDRYEIKGRGTIFIIESPVTAKRTDADMRNAVGERIVIDGVEYFVKGFNMYLPATPISIGEHVAILTTKI